MHAGTVPPVAPVHRGQLHCLSGLPAPLGVDELSLIEAVHRLGEGVVVGEAHGGY